MPMMRSLRQRAQAVCEVEKPQTGRWATLQKFQSVIVLGIGLIGAALLMAVAEFFRRRSPIVLYVAIFLAISIALDRLIRAHYRNWLIQAGRARQFEGEMDRAADYSGAVEADKRYFRSGAGG